MKKLTSILAVLALAFGLSVSFALPAAAMHNFSFSDVRMLSDGSLVVEDGSRLKRKHHALSAHLHTEELPAGHAVTMWWVIFDNPDECTAGEGDLKCGEADLFNPDTEATVQFADGRYIPHHGFGHYSSYLKVGDTDRIYLGDGLDNPEEAEVHLALRDHGPRPDHDPKLAREMISTFGANCTPDTDPFGIDTPGDYECQDLQFAAHVVL